MRLRRPDSAISPTGHFTGATWVRAGISDPALATTTGRVLYDATRLPLRAAGRLGLPTLDGLLLSRHAIIDGILGDAIASGVVNQVVELAAGLSPRGLTFARRHGDRLTYVEADLPGMAATKRRLLGPTGSLGPRHRVVEVDAFAAGGPASLAAITADLDRSQGLAVITEGLLNYFGTDQVAALWARTAALLGEFSAGLYLSDLVLARRDPLVSVAVTALSAFVRGWVHVPWSGPDEATAALHDAGFGSATLHRADRHPIGQPWADDPAARLVWVIEAAP